MTMREVTQSSIYVNRADELNEIRSRLNAVRLGRPVFDTILVWHGIPGIGKTTLRHMIANLCQEMRVPFSQVDFELRDRPKREVNRIQRYAQDPVLILEDLMLGLAIEEPKAFREALERYRQEEEDTFLYDEYRKRAVQAFLDYVNDLLKRGPIVLLFDTTDQALESLITWLEEQVIRPLALTGRCIIIWTGRYPQRWKRFEVRRRVVAAKLEPLPKEATEQQIGPSLAARVFPFTRGHPMGNREVATAIREYQARDKEVPDHVLINELVDRVIDRYVMVDIPDDLNAALRLLAVVRQFDVVFLQRLLSKFVPEFKDMRETLFLEVLSRLAGTYLVEWDDKRKGYRIDPILRRILALHLRHTAQERYVEANREAATIYADWIERAPAGRSVYVVERQYHEACVFLAEGKPAEWVVTDLERELMGYLKEYYSDRDPLYAQQATMQLLQELKGDDELGELLGDAFSRLVDTVEQHLASLR